MRYDLVKKAVATLFLKGWTHKDIMELLGISRYTVEIIIQKNVVEETTVYKNRLADFYPYFNRYMVILDTNVLEMRSPVRSKILSNKRCAIFLKMANGKSNDDCYKIVGLLGRGRQAIYMYNRKKGNKDIKDLLLLLN